MSSRYCKRGHPMTPEHGCRVKTKRNGREHWWWNCRTCRRMRDQLYYLSRFAPRVGLDESAPDVAKQRRADLARALGAQLRSARVERHVSEEAAAENAGLWPTFLRALECGEIERLTVDTLIHLCDSYGLTLEVRQYNDAIAAYRAEAEAAKARRAQRDLFKHRGASSAAVESCRAEFERATAPRSRRGVA